MAKDLCFLNIAKEGESEIPLKLVGECSGPAAVLQKLLLYLFCEDTTGLRAGTGGAFAQLVGQSNIKELLDLKQSLALRLSEAVEQIQADQQGSTLDDDSRLSAARLATVNTSDDSLTVVLELTTVSGSTTWNVTTKH